MKVEGHCDERGTADYNIVLGDKRAKAARSYGLPFHHIPVTARTKAAAEAMERYGTSASASTFTQWAVVFVDSAFSSSAVQSSRFSRRAAIVA